MKTKALILSLSLSVAAFNSFAQVGGTPPTIENATQTQATNGAMPGWAISTKSMVDGVGKALPAFGPASGWIGAFLGLTGFIFPNNSTQGQQKIQKSLNDIKIQLDINNAKIDNITAMYINDSKSNEEKNFFDEITTITDMSKSYVSELGNNNLDNYIKNNQYNFAGLAVINDTIGSYSAYDKIKKARTILSNTKYLNQLITVIQRANEPINLPKPGTVDYIQLHNTTNNLFLYYYSSIVAALAEAYELNRLSLYLENTAPYNSYYATKIGNPDGISSALTYSEQLTQLDSIYKSALDNVNTAFAPAKLINVYRDLPYYDEKTSAKDFYELYGVTFYNGQIIEGTKNYGKLESVPYTVKADEIYELGKVHKFNGQAYYINQTNQNIFATNYPAHVIDGTDRQFPIAGAVRYDWYEGGMTNIVIPVNSFANVIIVENLYNTPKLNYSSNDPTWGKTFYKAVYTVQQDSYCGNPPCNLARSTSYNNIMEATDKTTGKKYMFNLSIMQVGGDYWGYKVNSYYAALAVYRLSCASFDCTLVQPSGGFSYLEYADGYKIWMTGDGSTNPGRGIVGSYTEKPSRQ